MFDVEDNSFNSGKVGLGTGSDAVYGKFTNISVKGNVDNYLRIIETTPNNDDIGVPLNTSIELKFDRNIDPITVNENSVYFFENEDRLVLNNDYSLLVQNDKLAVDVFERKENTNYKIVVTKDLKSLEDGNSLKDEYIFNFETYKGDDYITYEYSKDKIADWEISDLSKLVIEEDCVRSNAYDAKSIIMLATYRFRDEFTYSAICTNSAAASSNMLHLYFNYIDSKNHYDLSYGGSNVGENLITLSKTIGGVKTVLGTSIQGNNKKIDIKYKNGVINVYSDDVRIFDIMDTSLISGRIGMAIDNTLGKFSDISIVGFGDDVRLKVANKNFGDNNVPVDTRAEIDFNYSIKKECINKENIYVTENEKQISKDLYEIISEDNNKRI